MKLKLLLPIFFGVALLLLSFYPQAARGENPQALEGDARKGWQVFSEKGCAKCHGIGEKRTDTQAPDLTNTPFAHLSSAGLAAAMWNHAPAMWEVMSTKSYNFKKIDTGEMKDLFSFLYFMRYLDEPGDPARGKEVLQKKGCARCHSIGGDKGRIGPDLALWKEYKNPLAWVQLMWNHAIKMKKAMERGSTREWPKLESHDIADIIAYVGSLGGRPVRAKALLAPGDPVEGRRTFTDRGCKQCHPTEGTGKSIGPNLGVARSDLPPTVGQLASLMWNHFPVMFNEMQKEKIKMPLLSTKDIADITAYLFSIRYFDPPGDRQAGKDSFYAKKCNVCHAIQVDSREKSEGPNLAAIKDSLSPITLASALWNHGPKMVEKMREKNIQWYKISDKELINLMAYLNHGE